VGFVARAGFSPDCFAGLEPAFFWGGMGANGNAKFDRTICKRAKLLCLLGATDAQMAKIFGVADSTWSDWKVKHPELAQALHDGKYEADAKVAVSLYQRATGYRHIDFKMFLHEGRVITKRFVKHYPPDTMAAMYWLNNRQRLNWAQRQEVTGAGGGPLEVKDVTDIEAARAIAFAMEEARQALQKAERSSKQKEKA
jgi:hypothetical protein